MANELFTRYRGRIQGPFTPEQLQILARRGQFTRTHEVSMDGTSWSRASNYPELFPASQVPRDAAQAEPIAEPVVEVELAPGGAGGATSPPAATAIWHYMFEGASKGPVDFTYLVYLINSQQITADDLVWKDGFPNWIPAHQVPGLVKPAPIGAAGPATGIATPYDDPQFPRVSALSVASLVMGILGACPVLGLLAVIFGGVAVHQIRISRNRMRGTGLAIAGLSLGVVWLGLWLLYIITTVAMAIANSPEFH